MASRRSQLTREMVAYRMQTEADMFLSGVSEMTGKAIFEDNVAGPGSGGRHVIRRFGGVKKSSIYSHFKQGPKVLGLAIRRGKGPLFRSIRRETRRYVLKHDQEAIDEILSKSPRSLKQVRELVAAHPSLTKKCTSCKHEHTARKHRGHGVGSFERRGVIVSTARPSDAPDWWDDVL